MGDATIFCVVVFVVSFRSLTCSLIVYSPATSYVCSAVFTVVQSVSYVLSLFQSQRTRRSSVASSVSLEEEASTDAVMPLTRLTAKTAVGAVLLAAMVKYFVAESVRFAGSFTSM